MLLTWGLSWGQERAGQVVGYQLLLSPASSHSTLEVVAGPPAAVTVNAECEVPGAFNPPMMQQEKSHFTPCSMWTDLDQPLRQPPALPST